MPILIRPFHPPFPGSMPPRAAFLPRLPANLRLSANSDPIPFPCTLSQLCLNRNRYLLSVLSPCPSHFFLRQMRPPQALHASDPRCFFASPCTPKQPFRPFAPLLPDSVRGRPLPHPWPPFTKVPIGSANMVTLRYPLGILSLGKNMLHHHTQLVPIRQALFSVPNPPKLLPKPIPKGLHCPRVPKDIPPPLIMFTSTKQETPPFLSQHHYHPLPAVNPFPSPVYFVLPLPLRERFGLPFHHFPFRVVALSVKLTGLFIILDLGLSPGDFEILRFFPLRVIAWLISVPPFSILCG